MARKLRIHFPGAVYHVLLRGNAGETVFYDDQDRVRFCLLLQEGIERFGHRIHAFCLMGNHIHLLIQIADVSLSRIMQNLGVRFTLWMNRHHKRSGHIFQGRFKAILIDCDSYLLELVRYIHLNPVRAKMVANPEEYAWSAHRAYLGTQLIPWLTTSWVLASFGPDRGTRSRSRYSDFVLDGIGEGYRPEFGRGVVEGRILGDDDFAGKALHRTGEARGSAASIEDVLVEAAKISGVSLGDMVSERRGRKIAESRSIAAWLVREIGHHLTLVELSKKFDRDISTLSLGARRIAEQAKVDSTLASDLAAARTSLLQTQ